MLIRLLPLVLAAACLSVAPAWARTWTSADGAFTIEADLIEARADGTLLLQNKEGQKFEVVVTKLSPADQQFVRDNPPGGAPGKTLVPKPPPSTEPPKANLRPAPADEVVALRLKEIRSVLNDAYQQANGKPGGRRQLCEKLMKLARESLATDPVAAYTMANEAAMLAAEEGELTDALASITWLSEQFTLPNAPALKLEVVRRFKFDSLTAASLRGVFGQLIALMDEAEARADYNSTFELGRMAMKVATKNEDAALISYVKTRGKRLLEQRELFDAAAKAIQTLAANPKDPQANAALGRFLCFVRGQWDDGLPRLATGSDAELAALAKRDLANPASPEEQAAVANDWWTLGESTANPGLATSKTRAGHWYEKAMPKLTALEKLRAEKRLADVRQFEKLNQPPGTEGTGSTPEGGSTQGAIAFAPRPPREKTGPFSLTAKGGISAELFARSVIATGGSLKPGAGEKIRSGDTKTITNSDGSDPTWEVYVPASYDGKIPYGLFVYVSSGDTGGCPGNWMPVMDKHRLIWICANKSGNGHQTGLRHALAIAGVQQVRERYQLDSQRIYVSGKSGGGRVCSQLMIVNADLFTGGFPHVGCNPYRNLPIEGNRYYAASIQVNPRLLKLAARQNRYVFLTGERDFNRDQTRLIYNQYKSDGFQHLTYLEVPGMEHAAPDPAWLGKGIVALDAPLAASAKTSFSNAARDEKRELSGPALEGYGRALARGAQLDFAAEANTKYDTLRKQYEEEVAGIENLLKAGNAAAARDGLTQLRRRWTRYAQDDVQRLEGALKATRD